ncbi:hypothetical protein K491DRAFT_680751 [Lophiostoma macrostomum CBS 122681]|uniref:Uncharacterized protein n=1 Tax=Lophiostoma macrostomum CBS 122681 TaxID=1314788 RepID=A0A6A6SZE2_9PLEO|nr:hypothetical protein K491DRAFT_680751 [Lophiostoma macrostomum CBS 122681]
MFYFFLIFLGLLVALAAGQSAHVYTTVMVMDGTTMTMTVTSGNTNSAMSGMSTASTTMDASMSGMSMGPASHTAAASSGLARETSIPITVGAVGLAIAAVAGNVI